MNFCKFINKQYPTFASNNFLSLSSPESDLLRFDLVVDILEVITREVFAVVDPPIHLDVVFLRYFALHLKMCDQYVHCTSGRLKTSLAKATQKKPDLKHFGKSGSESGNGL